MQKSLNLVGVASHGLSVLVAVGVIGTLAMTFTTSQEVSKVSADVGQIRATINQASQTQLPVTPEEVQSILMRPEGDCLRTYVQKSLAASQVVLRGQVQQGSGVDACQLANALDLQKQALESSKAQQTQQAQ